MSTPSYTSRIRDRYFLSPFSLTLGSIGATGFSLFVFLALTALETFGGYRTQPPALMFIPLLALPGATVGALFSWHTKRHWPFFLGLAVTLSPIVCAFVLPEVFDPTLGQAGSD